MDMGPMPSGILEPKLRMGSRPQSTLSHTGYGSHALLATLSQNGSGRHALRRPALLATLCQSGYGALRRGDI